MITQAEKIVNKLYYNAHRDTIIARSKEYYQKHHDEVRLKQNEYKNRIRKKEIV